MNRVESSRVGSSRVESSRVESSRVESRRVGSGRVESGRVESGRVGSSRVESSRVESGRVESSRVESSRVESSRVESKPITSNQIKSDQIRSNQIKSDQIRSNQIKSDPIRSNQNKSDQIRSKHIKAYLIKSDQSTSLLQNWCVLPLSFAISGVCGLALVIIDTVAAAFSLDDENNNAEAARAIRSMRSIGEPVGALVGAVHHYGKTTETGLRGASAFHAGADTVISVLANRNQTTGEVSNRSISLAKSRSTDEGPVSGFDLVFMNLGIDEDDEIFGSCAVAPNGAVVSGRLRRPEPQSKVQFRTAFQEALKSHGVVRPDLTGDQASHAVPLRHVREALGRLCVAGDDDPKKRAERARKAVVRAITTLSGEFTTRLVEGVEWIWSK